MKFFKERIEYIFPFILFILILVLKYPVLNLPYSWDVMNYVIPATQYIYENGFTIFLWNYSNGHPPFYFIFLGFIFKLFGSSQIVSHLVIVFFSFLATYYTYLLGKHLFSRRVGFISSFMMFFYPTFFSHSGMSHLAIPLTALTIMSIYYFIKGYKIIYVIFSSLLVLTNEMVIVVPVALLFYKFLNDKRINIKKNLIFFIPLFIFLSWLLSNKLYYGYFFWPQSLALFSINIIKIILSGFIILKNLFFDYYKWILTSFVLISCFSLKLLVNKKRVFLSLILSFILFFLMFNSPMLSIYFNNYFPNIINYFLILKKFSVLFSFLFLVFLLSINKFVDFWNNKRFYPLYSVLIFAFLFYTLFIPFAPRYALPIYPIIFIIFSIALIKIFKKYSYFIFIIILLLFITQWFGDRDTVGFTLESNMEYADAIKTHKEAASYIENNFPNSVIIASYPQSLELQFPYLGYVSKPLNVISIPPWSGLVSKNFTLYFNPEKYERNINLNTLDIIYYSDQEFETRYSQEIYSILNKNLIKNFELNGKIVKIYKINKNVKYPNYTLPPD